MAPEPRLVPRFAAEPPQEMLPYGRWGERLQAELLAAALRIDTEDLGDLGELEDILWFPDRTWHGRTYVPATATTTSGLEVFGHVSYVRGADDSEEPSQFAAQADATDETAARHPEWAIDLCDEEIGTWRGEEGNVATMTLVWGRPMVQGSVIATGELAGLCVDQCVLADGRFTLLAPDDYRGDTLDVLLFDKRGDEVARESLYADDGDDEDPEDDE